MDRQTDNIEHRLLAILEGTRTGTWEWNVQTGETFFNERWAQILGYTLDELKPTTIQTWIDLCHPEDLAISSGLLQRHFQGELDYYECEARMRHKDGHWVWVLDRGKVHSWTSDDKPLWMFGTHQDISERKLSEETLRETRETLTLFIEHAPASLAMFDRDMRYLSVSRRWRDNFRLGDRDIIGRLHYDIFPEIPEQWRDAHRRGLAGEVLRSDGDRFERADGTVQWVTWEIRPWYNVDQKVGGIVLFTENVTEQMAAAETIAQSEQKYRVLFEEAAHGAAVADAETGIILACNLRLAQMIGREVGEIVGRHQSILHPEQGRIQGFSPTFNAHRVKSASGADEDLLLTSDGRLLDVEIVGTKFRLGDREIVQGVFYDITERKRLMAEFLRSAQLAALGTAAAGVAHEVNNPLQGILNFATLINDAPDNVARVSDFSARIVKESRRIMQLTRDMLGYARDNRGALLLADIRDLITGAVSLARINHKREGIVFRLELPPEPVIMSVDPQGIQQVVLNLVDNACDALRQKGNGADGAPVLVRGYVNLDGGQPIFGLEVVDHGCGIPAGLVNKVRDAFFTTKPRSQGTGLGLSIVGEIVAKHEGVLEIESEEGQFTKVAVSLPMKVSQ